MAPRLLSCFRKRRGGGVAHGSLGESVRESSATADLTAEEMKRGGPVLVELFSSQGCTTSPAAELLVSRLGRGDFRLEMPVVVLAFHVDYWDYMGWKDPYGSSQWTVRQKAYVESLGLDTLFTPQIVVQGKAHCVGNDENALITAISEAPRYPVPSFEATFQKPSPDSLQVSLAGALRMKVDGNGVNVMVALYESGLLNNCEKGENKGRVLSNDYVVRRLEKLCNVKDMSPKKTVSGTLNFALWEGFNAAKCGVALFVQNNSHQIFGSQSFKLPEGI
ncbi:uncharacterized protein LOC129295081 [Prosopis cineraria]|uniref:uncharacterized protein LOC129295081 n=1 Tax=Prosopis cineraria TaxID=364024 RepID=UPI00240FB54C|nr:uncharacterized protein LOC129295081 [Prosopis cineraria]